MTFVFVEWFVVMQVFSVAVLGFLLTTTIIMMLIFIQAIAEQDWYYWIFSMVTTGLMGIAGTQMHNFLQMSRFCVYKKLGSKHTSIVGLQTSKLALDSIVK